MLINDLLKETPNNKSWNERAHLMQYKKSFLELWVDCKNAIETQNPMDIYMNLPRLMRVLLDDNADKKINNRTLIQSTFYMINTLFSDYNKGKQEFYNIRYPTNRDYIVSEPLDTLTFKSSNPKLIKEFTELFNKYVNKPVTLISLGNGSTRPCLLMMPLIQEKINDYIPVRFSYYKHDDRKPYFNENDIQRLRNDKLFIFDEDRSSGTTLELFKNYLLSQGFDRECMNFGTIITAKLNPENVMPDLTVIQS